MPYEVRRDESACSPALPWGVFKPGEQTPLGCHASEADAEAQMAALYAAEDDDAAASPTALIIAEGVLDDGGQGVDADRRRDLIRQIELGNFNAVSVEAAGVDVAEDCLAMDDDGACQQWRMTFSRYRLGAASVVTIPAIEGTLIELDPPGAAGEGRRFRAILAREGVETDEGFLTRAFPPDCFEWGDGPWTLTAHHDDYVILGRFDRITRVPLMAAAADGPVAAPAVAAAASSGELVVPAAWIAEPDDLPDLDSPGSRVPVVTADGRVYGWLASWDDCHTSFAGYCQTPWRSESGYAYAMHSGPFLTDEGDRVSLAPLAASGGHYATEGAAARNWRAARSHYDNPATCAAYVAYGENDRGIWFAGIVNPDAPDALVNLLRRHQLSGDWRRPFGSWELMGACSVNQPGFVRRAAWAASADGTLELVAAVTASLAPRACCDECAAASAGRAAEAGQEAVVAAADDEMVGMMRDVHRMVSDMHDEMIGDEEDEAVTAAAAPSDLTGARLAAIEARLAVLVDHLEPAIRDSLRSRLAG